MGLGLSRIEMQQLYTVQLNKFKSEGAHGRGIAISNLTSKGISQPVAESIVDSEIEYHALSIAALVVMEENNRKIESYLKEKGIKL
jgi:hypothetical protein